MFDPFRGSEATFLWAQTLRAFRTLFGVRRFIVNGYQFGAGNAEAIASGAYWFYYRLGFRPSAARKPRAGRGGGRDACSATAGDRARPRLRRLARGDLVLDLPDWNDRDAFDEAALDEFGTVVSRQLATVPLWGREDGARALARKWHGPATSAVGSGRRPSAPRSSGSRRCAARCRTGRSWPHGERVALGALLRARGGASELPYARHATAHPRILPRTRGDARRAAAAGA